MLNVEVDGIVAGVELAAGEPLIEWGVGRVQYVLPGPVPLARLGGAAPESLRRADRLVAGALIVAGHGRPLHCVGVPSADVPAIILSRRTPVHKGRHRRNSCTLGVSLATDMMFSDGAVLELPTISGDMTRRIQGLETTCHHRLCASN